MVIVRHVDVPWWSARGGFIGVNFFFVLSGFLITTLLLEEHDRNGSIKLPAFYARRALRLLPALIVLLIASITIVSFSNPADVPLIAKSAVHMMLYVTNWTSLNDTFPAPRLLGHGWSLAIEEQFYLVWPFLLILFLKRMNRKTLVWVTGAMFLAAAAWRAHVWLENYGAKRVYFGSDTNADGLLAGVFTAALMSAGIYPKSEKTLKALHLVSVVLVLLIPVATMKLIYYGNIAWWLYIGGLPLIELGVGVLIMGLLLTPLRTLFEKKPLVWTGKVSYGLYLWHFPMITLSECAFGAICPMAELTGVILGFLAATASYYAVERPILTFKKRFEIVKPAQLDPALVNP
jgi:peptidoglycan/LPS O-acetylase OafA/YrhL